MTSAAQMPDERKAFVLCADDFAMTGPVSRAILTLLDKGRISATCAMTNRPDWKHSGQLLRAFHGRADLGLHLNLTSGAPLGAMPALAPTGLFLSLAETGRRGMGSSAVRSEIATEIERQLDAFETVMGMAPDFVDGHRHVHVLPGIRQALLGVLQRRYAGAGHRLYVRVPTDRLGAIRQRRLFITKAVVVRTLAAGFARMVHRAGFDTNRGFAGFSDFSSTGDYAAAFRSYLIAPGPAHLVMCHPGHVDEELAHLDPVLDARENEFAFLMGDQFPEILRQAGLRLGRFSETRLP